MTEKSVYQKSKCPEMRSQSFPVSEISHFWYIRTWGRKIAIASVFQSGYTFSTLHRFYRQNKKKICHTVSALKTPTQTSYSQDIQIMICWFEVVHILKCKVSEGLSLGYQQTEHIKNGSVHCLNPLTWLAPSLIAIIMANKQTLSDCYDLM